MRHLFVENVLDTFFLHPYFTLQILHSVVAVLLSPTRTAMKRVLKVFYIRYLQMAYICLNDWLFMGVVEYTYFT